MRKNRGWRLWAWAALLGLVLTVTAPIFHSHPDGEEHHDCPICLACIMLAVTASVVVAASDFTPFFENLLPASGLSGRGAEILVLSRGPPPSAV